MHTPATPPTLGDIGDDTMTTQRTDKPQPASDANEGEGNKTAARNDNDRTRAFVDAGKVDEAARAAEEALDGDEAEDLAEAEELGKSKARG